MGFLYRLWCVASIAVVAANSSRLRFQRVYHKTANCGHCCIKFQSSPDL